MINNKACNIQPIRLIVQLKIHTQLSELKTIFNIFLMGVLLPKELSNSIFL